MDWPAARTSLLLAFLTAAFLLPIGVALARWLATTSWRGKPLFEALVTLPLLLPPTVIGFYLLTAFGQNSALGAWLAQNLNLHLVFSFEGLLFASVLVNLPFMVQTHTTRLCQHSAQPARSGLGIGLVHMAHLLED